MGFVHHNNSLYIHLGDEKTHKIVLTHKKAHQPYLKTSNVLIQNWKKTKEKLSFDMLRIVPATVNIAGLKPHHKYDYTIGNSKFSKNADKEGNLLLSSPLRGEDGGEGVINTLILL